MTDNQSDRLNTLELTLTKFAEISFKSHVEHDQALNRIEAAILKLTETVETNSKTIAQNSQDIRRILQYLEGQSGNGRSDS